MYTSIQSHGLVQGLLCSADGVVLLRPTAWVAVTWWPICGFDGHISTVNNLGVTLGGYFV